MMRFNDEQRDVDMQRRISERTPVETDMLDDEDLTVLVARLLLEHGVDVPSPALAFHLRCSPPPPQRMPTTRRARPASDPREQGAPLTRGLGGGAFVPCRVRRSCRPPAAAVRSRQ
jgi:hypothetical protein